MTLSEDDGWSDIRAWPDARLGDLIGDGSINHVRHVQVEGRRRVARISRRSTEDLDWEINLLDELRSAGLDVPQLVPTIDGRLRSGRMVVMEWVDGTLPDGAADSQRIAQYLHRLHEITSGWTAQRPGWHTCAELVTVTRSGPVDVTKLPPDVLVRCRRAWSRLPLVPLSVIHGDPTPPNVRITRSSVALLDWDEARIDNPVLDSTYVPAAREALAPELRQCGRQAFCAWEAALFWDLNHEYALRQLAEVDRIEADYSPEKHLRS